MCHSMQHAIYLPGTHAAAEAHQLCQIEVGSISPDPLDALCLTAGLLCPSAGTARALIDDEDCTICCLQLLPQAAAWKVKVKGHKLPYVVKRWPTDRVQSAGEQVSGKAPRLAMTVMHMGPMDCDVAALRGSKLQLRPVTA